MRYRITESYFLWISLWAAILTALLTWSIGVTVASLGRKHVLTVAPILAGFGLWMMRSNLSAVAANGPLFWILYALVMTVLLFVPFSMGRQGSSRVRARVGWVAILFGLGVASSGFLLVLIPEFSWAPFKAVAMFLAKGWPFLYSLRRTVRPHA